MPEIESDGGPSGYYDFPPAETLNDMLEHKGEHHWKGDSFHIANIVKACWRWGSKSGTSFEYDLNKIIYSACRLMMKYVGATKMRENLIKILDDPQFRERKENETPKVPTIYSDGRGDWYEYKHYGSRDSD